MIDRQFKLFGDWVLELVMFKYAWNCIADINLCITGKNDVMFAHGFSFHIITFNYTLFELNIFNDEWGIGDDGDEGEDLMNGR